MDVGGRKLSDANFANGRECCIQTFWFGLIRAIRVSLSVLPIRVHPWLQLNRPVLSRHLKLFFHPQARTDCFHNGQ
jgi:hypothetical protein